MDRKKIDVLCAGQSVYDLVLTLDHHPNADEKMVASSLSGWGGGPAANAAVTAARLGHPTAFCGYLGADHFGDLHLAELQAAGIDTTYLVRGSAPTPLSVALVKPDGQRTLINYRKSTPPLSSDAVDLSMLDTKVVLFDGLEPDLSPGLAVGARAQGVITILDAGSVHPGTLALMGMVDYLVCSEKFAHDYTGQIDERFALEKLRRVAPAVVVTLGARGLIWARAGTSGQIPAFQVEVVDTTGAGDVFHGAFAAGVATGLGWEEMLTYSTAAASLSCTRRGGRPAIPTSQDVDNFIHHSPAFLDPTIRTL